MTALETAIALATPPRTAETANDALAGAQTLADGAAAREAQISEAIASLNVLLDAQRDAHDAFSVYRNVLAAAGRDAEALALRCPAQPAQLLVSLHR